MAQHEEELIISITAEGASVTDASVKQVTRSVEDLQKKLAATNPLGVEFKPIPPVDFAKAFSVPAMQQATGVLQHMGIEYEKVRNTMKAPIGGDSGLTARNFTVAAKGLDALGKSAADARNESDKLGQTLSFFQKVFVAREIIKLSEALEELSDSAVNLQNKMKVLSEDGESGVASKMQNVYDIAIKTGQPLESVSTGFFRLSEATKEMGATQGQVLRVTKTLNEAMAISGATSVEAKNGMIQLSQGLSLGVVKGQDLRAVISDIPVIGRAIADHFGVSIGQLRAMAAQGNVTAKEVFTALLEYTDQADKKFGKMGETFERAWNSFRTKGIQAFQDSLMELNKLTGAIDKLGDGFDYIIAAITIMSRNWDKMGENFENSTMMKAINKVGGFLSKFSIGGFAGSDTLPSNDPFGQNSAKNIFGNADDQIRAEMSKIRAARAALLHDDPNVMDTSNLKETNQKTGKERGKTLEELIRLEKEKMEIQRVGISQTKEEKEVWADYMSQVEKLAPSIKNRGFNFNDPNSPTGQLFSLIQKKHDLAEVALLIQSITEAIKKQHEEMARKGIAAGAHAAENLAKSRAQIQGNANSALAEVTPFNGNQQKINALQDVLAHPEAMASALNAAGEPADKLEETMTGIRVQIQLLTMEMNPLAAAFKGVADTMTQGFADAIAQSIVLHKNLGDLLDSLIKVVAQQAIAGLITAGIGGTANGGTGLIGLINTGMAGHAAGGYTGNYGTSQVAGVVHGQEYVLNAAATKAIGRGTLDAMNAGYAPSGNGGTKITINNNAPGIDASASVNQSGHVEILIQKKIAEMTPHVVASQISQSNSAVSKALSRHIDANRRNV